MRRSAFSVATFVVAIFATLLNAVAMTAPAPATADATPAAAATDPAAAFILSFATLCNPSGEDGAENSSGQHCAHCPPCGGAFAIAPQGVGAYAPQRPRLEALFEARLAPQSGFTSWHSPRAPPAA